MNTKEEQQDEIDQNSNENYLHADIQEVLIVDEEGLSTQNIFNLDYLKNNEVDEPFDFIEGYHDAKRDKDFSQTSKSYVKGYKYGKTGKF